MTGLAARRRAGVQDALARLRVEIAIVSFGGRAELAADFVTADRFCPPVLGTAGNTPMGSAIDLALDLIESRKQTYKANGTPYFRPWIFLVTDGEPTDGNRWQEAARRVQSAESGRKVSFFAVGVGAANLDILGQINPARAPLLLQGLKFREMFQWLSASMQSVSRAEPGADVPLQTPIGWASTGAGA